jgi:two-component system CheB/CheR fusion protein
VALNLPIVGIGASAGGVEALEQFFKAIPADHGMAFVVVTHLSPSHESMLAEILGRATRMPVFYARDGELVQPQQVHVLPPGATLTIRERRLRLRLTGAADRERTPIDVFFIRSPRTRESMRSALCCRAAAATARSASRRSRRMAG